MRRPVKNRKRPGAESKYNSEKLARFTNYIMLDGKKNIARTLVYGALDHIKEEMKVEDPLEIFNQAVENVGPQMEVRSRRVGGANYQVPVEVRPERRTQLALRWITEASRVRGGKPSYVRIAEEIMAAANNEGSAVTKKENVHKMANANKAFAHFAW